MKEHHIHKIEPNGGEQSLCHLQAALTGCFTDAPMAQALKAFLLRAYSPKHLLVTNTATLVTLLGLGDYVQQRFQGDDWDWRRSVRFASIGLVIGPMNTQWYRFLDSKIPGKTLKEVMRKIATDFCVSPVFAVTFIGGVALLEGKSPTDALNEYKSKFIRILTLDLCVWPPAQVINFVFLSPPFRVLYLATVMLFYSCVASYIKHKESDWNSDISSKFSK